MKKREDRNDVSEGAIFARLWENCGDGLSPKLAREILKLRFVREDDRRMHELAVKNQQGQLTRREKKELDSYIKVGDLVAILQSKARMLLKAKTA